MPSEDSTGASVDIELLEFDEDLALLDGVAFSGIVRSLYPDGTLEASRRYRDGLPEGLCEWWYPNGQIFKRSIAVRGQGSSEAWEWYPNGTQRSYRRYDQLFAIEKRAWDESGGEIDPATLGSTNSAEVFIELFDEAMALKKAADASGTSFDTDG